MPNGCPPGSQQYTIAAGDTLFGLAQRFGTTVAAITSANPGINPNDLRVGQLICVPRGGGAPGPGPGPCPRNWERYAIRAGDTLYAIAQSRGTTVSALTANNPGINPNDLRVGQLICVPRGGGAPGPGPCPGTFYTIRSGDTLFRIANERGTTVDAIIRLNPSLNSNNLQVGQIICLP
jgi:LysM repeat protein